MSNETWKIIDSDNREDISSSWIEEEEFILNWVEHPVFEKKSLESIAISFIYINIDDEIVGILKSSVNLEKQHSNSILHQSVFLDKVNIAKNPISINEDNKHNWLEKSYMFKDTIIYYPSNEQNTHNPSSFHPLYFSNDIAKIPNSISVLHDLYEIVVIMREIKPTILLKSIIKPATNNSTGGGGGGGKTKKVRISEDLPKEIIYVKNKSSLKSKRRTRKCVK
jgi:hypothetical protein